MLKTAAGARRQFAILNNKVLLLYVNKGTKFTDCTSYTDVTANVTCKVGMFTSILKLKVFRAENSCIVDMNINDYLFVNLQINLIYNCYRGKCLKFNQSKCRVHERNSHLKA